MPTLPNIVGGSIEAQATIQAQPKTGLITKTEVDAALAATRQYSELGHKFRAAEREMKKQVGGIFERLLGVKSLDEVSSMSPNQIAVAIKERVEAGLVKLEDGNFDIKLSKKEQRPSWKDEFIAANGEAAAKGVMTTCPYSFHYRLEPHPQTKQ